MASIEPRNPVMKVREALESNKAISFGPPIADKEHPEIMWQCYGLVTSNEVAVIARCGELEIGACRESGLLYPHMADRIFGMDVADQDLALQLSEAIWSRDGERLLEEARRTKPSKA